MIKTALKQNANGKTDSSQLSNNAFRNNMTEINYFYW